MRLYRIDGYDGAFVLLHYQGRVNVKELFVSIITASVGVSLLSSTVIGERFRGNVKAVSSLLLIVSLLSLVVCEVPKLDKSFQEISFDEGRIYSSVEEYAEGVYSNLVEARIKESFRVVKVKVYCDISLDEDTAMLESIKVCLQSDEKLVTVLDFVEKEFEAYGKVSVSKLNEGKN